MFGIRNANFKVWVLGFFLDGFLDFLHLGSRNSRKGIAVAAVFADRYRKDQVEVGVFEGFHFCTGFAMAAGDIGWILAVDHGCELQRKSFVTAAGGTIEEIGIGHAFVADHIEQHLAVEFLVDECKQNQSPFGNQSSGLRAVRFIQISK